MTKRKVVEVVLIRVTIGSEVQHIWQCRAHQADSVHAALLNGLPDWLPNPRLGYDFGDIRRTMRT
jgi:hypothetical protein